MVDHQERPVIFPTATGQSIYGSTRDPKLVASTADIDIAKLAAEATEKALAIAPPSQTIYVNNVSLALSPPHPQLNERINVTDLKASLEAIFCRFGPLLDIVANKTLKGRGQAFIVFADVATATMALKQMQGFPFYDKPMRIAFAKSKSHAVAKLDGTWVPPEERVPPPPLPMPEPVDLVGAATDESAPRRVEMEPAPFETLFVENLPEEMSKIMLTMLFEQFAGFKQVQMVPQRLGLAFVEFEDASHAGVARNGLQGFRVTPENAMKITFAKH